MGKWAENELNIAIKLIKEGKNYHEIGLILN
jgi:hypothetical protein